MSRCHHRKNPQLMIKDTLIIPAEKPDIEFILRVSSRPTVDKVVVTNRRIDFSGQILIGVEYVAYASDGTQPIHFVSFELPFEGVLNKRFARTDMTAEMKATAEFCQFQNTSPRDMRIAINVKAYIVKITRAYKPLFPPGYNSAINLHYNQFQEVPLSLLNQPRP